MSKMTIAGKALVLTSGVSTAILEKVKRYSPEALTLRDAETKEPVFGITSGKVGSISKNLIVYDDVTADGFARVTFVPEVKSLSKDWVKSEYGLMLFQLEQLEVNIKAAFDTVSEKITSVEDKITEVI